MGLASLAEKQKLDAIEKEKKEELEKEVKMEQGWLDGIEAEVIKGLSRIKNQFLAKQAEIAGLNDKRNDIKNKLEEFMIEHNIHKFRLDENRVLEIQKKSKHLVIVNKKGVRRTRSGTVED